MTRLCESGASATNQTTKTPVLHEMIQNTYLFKAVLSAIFWYRSFPVTT